MKKLRNILIVLGLLISTVGFSQGKRLFHDGKVVVIDALHPAFEKYQAAMSEPWTGDTIQKFNDMLVALDNAGHLDSMYVFHFYASTTEADAYINVVNPGTYNGVENGTVAFTRLRYIEGNATDAYVETGLNPTTASIPENRVTAGIGIADNQQDGQYVFGASLNFALTVRGTVPADYATAKINSTNFSQISGVTNSKGHWDITRTASNATAIHYNGSEIRNNTDASEGLVNTSFTVLKRSDTSSETDYQVVYFFVMRGGINATQASEIKTPIETFLAYIGGELE